MFPTTKTTHTVTCRIGDFMHISISIVGCLKFVQKAYMSIIMASALHFRHASYCGYVVVWNRDGAKMYEMSWIN